MPSDSLPPWAGRDSIPAPGQLLGRGKARSPLFLLAPLTALPVASFPSTSGVEEAGADPSLTRRSLGPGPLGEAPGSLPRDVGAEECSVYPREGLFLPELESAVAPGEEAALISIIPQSLCGEWGLDASQARDLGSLWARPAPESTLVPRAAEAGTGPGWGLHWAGRTGLRPPGTAPRPASSCSPGDLCPGRGEAAEDGGRQQGDTQSMRGRARAAPGRPAGR